jgi:hypothetical protein
VSVYYFARYLRKGLAPPGYTTAPTKSAPKKSKEQHLSPRSGAWALMLSDEKLRPKQRHWIGGLGEDRGKGEVLYRLARRFVEMVQEGKAAELERWLLDAQNSGVEELKNFAEGIVSQNLAAVRTALTEVWSNDLAPYCTLSIRSRVYPVFRPSFLTLFAAGSHPAVRISTRPCRCRGAPSRVLCGTRPSPSLC